MSYRKAWPDKSKEQKILFKKKKEKEHLGRKFSKKYLHSEEQHCAQSFYTLRNSLRLTL